MKLQYLGTAAAEAIPCLFCDCEVCRKARELGGREIRTRSQALINDQLLIDFPADTYFHAMTHNMDFSKINHCLITHVHKDHFSIQELAYLRKGFVSRVFEGYRGFHLYGSAEAEAESAELLAPCAEQVHFHRVELSEPFCIEDFTVTPLKARHGTQDPRIYLIQQGGKTLLWAHDTDIFPEETWDYLQALSPKLDAVSMDCTGCADEELAYHGHMCLGRNEKCRERLQQMGLAHKDTVFILNHFSHNGSNANYKDFTKLAQPRGFAVTYDGMTLTV